MYIHVADRRIVFPRWFSQLFTLLRITTVSPLIVESLFTIREIVDVSES